MSQNCTRFRYQVLKNTKGWNQMWNLWYVTLNQIPYTSSLDSLHVEASLIMQSSTSLPFVHWCRLIGGSNYIIIRLPVVGVTLNIMVQRLTCWLSIPIVWLLTWLLYVIFKNVVCRIDYVLSNRTLMKLIKLCGSNIVYHIIK